jgi:hypothetical protein
VSMIKQFAVKLMAVPFVSFIALTGSAYAADAPVAIEKLSPEEIMDNVINRYDGTTKVRKQEISTCKYGVKDNQISCSETPRIKAAETYGKDYGAEEEDSKALTIIVEPAAERGVGMLQYDYGDITRDPDQWIYLSAIGKPKRVASGKQDEDEAKKGSLFGSEFSLEDMEKIRLKDYVFTKEAEVKYSDRDCVVIQMLPTEKRAKKSNYSKILIWVDKANFNTLKTQYYDRKGVYVKRKTETDWVLENGIWYPKTQTMNNLIESRVSILKTTSVIYNVPIDDEFLTLRSLTDAAFRERNMKELKTSSL